MRHEVDAQNVLPAVVAHQRDLRMLLQAFDQLLDLQARHHAAGRIGRAVDDDQPRVRRDLAQDIVGVEGEAVFFQKRDR